MSNTGMDYLKPSFWATSFDDLPFGNFPLANLVDRSVEPQLASSGVSVNVPITPDFGLADSWTPGTTITSSNITQTSATVTLDKSIRKTIDLTQSEISLTPYNLIQKYGIPAAKSIVQTVNKDIYLEMMKTSNFVDAISSFTKDSVIAARTKLSKNEVEEGRYFIAGADDYGSMLGFDDFVRVDYMGSQEAIKNGQLTNRYGMSIIETQTINTYTPADLTGAISNVAGYLLGDTTIVVNGFNDDANPLRPGDLFKVAGETGTPYHTVISTVTTGNDTTSITFTPALVSAVADGAAITVTASRSCIAGVPSAIAFAARSYAAPVQSGNGMVNSAVMMLAGLPIRITVWFDSSNLNTRLQYDILYGVKVVNPNRLVRVLRA